jgi:arylsulfatase A-like enzyme
MHSALANWIRLLVVGLLSCGLPCVNCMVVADEAARPNILWISSEDNGPQLGCYGDTFATTPNIDRLANRSIRYTNCWSNAPVCAPARTTIITGMWPTSLGAQHMRSEVKLPPGMQLFPQLLRQAGYYCTNNSKEDYNVIKPGKVWDESSNKAHWRGRQPKQPFFAVFNFQTTHESQIRKRPHTAKHDATRVTVPPYHPDLPEVRRDWAQYYDKLEEMDVQVGELLKQLEDDDLLEDTIIVYFGDHGSGMPRSKRWLYQSGLHVPLLIHIPEKFKTLATSGHNIATASEELVGFIDLAPTMLSLSGVAIPDYMQGRALLGPGRQAEPECMVAFRDRMDERYDCSRAIRDQRYLYIRNWLPYRPQGQYLEYMFETPTTLAWKNAFDQGKTDSAQSFFWKPKPTEELYDIQNDPYQIHNLVNDKEASEALTIMRTRLQQWTVRTGDLGLLHEGEFHRLADSGSPREVGLNNTLYPIADIFAAADLAVRVAQNENELQALLQSSDPHIRYWGLHGLLTLASRDQKFAVEPVVGMLQDSSPINGALAAEIVGRYGTMPERAMALKRLTEIVSGSESNYFARLQALLSLDFIEAKPGELGVMLEAIPTSPGKLPGRYSPYLERTVARLKSKSN